MSGRDAILLDLDDTILAYGGVADGLWGELARRFAPRAPGVSADAIEDALDASRDVYWSDEERSRLGRLDLVRARREIVEGAFERLGLAAGPVAHELADAFTHEREERVTPFAGAIETLHALRDRGHRLGLLTNGTSEFQRRKIERFDLEGFFEVVLIEGELGFGKPDRRVFERALSSLGAAPDEAWMVGDNLRADIAGASALGIRTVWIDWAGRGLPEDAPARPDRELPALAGLPDLL